MSSVRALHLHTNLIHQQLDRPAPLEPWITLPTCVWSYAYHFISWGLSPLRRLNVL